MDRVDLLHLEGNIIDYDVKNIILDIDNCVFNSTEWERYIPKDGSREGWNNYHSHYYLICENPEMLEFLDKLYKREQFNSIYFLTAREDYDNMRAITIEQLNSAFSKYKWWDKISKFLYMRNACDYSPSYLVKQNILYSNILHKVQIDLAIDDDLENINMYRRNGINTIYYKKYKK